MFNKLHSLDLVVQSVVGLVVVVEVEFVFSGDIHLRMFGHNAQVQKSFPKYEFNRIKIEFGPSIPVQYDFALEFEVLFRIVLMLQRVNF
jgi:hypothetical protein